MSFPSTLLKIKRGEGWFAADRSWQSASHKLSDGAFKLFVYVSLAAERSTGRFVFRQGELAKALNKSRRSIGKYLRELEEKTALPDLSELQPACHWDPSDPRRLLAL